MQCVDCDIELPEDAVFCHRCGARTNDDAVAGERHVDAIASHDDGGTDAGGQRLSARPGQLRSQVSGLMSTPDEQEHDLWEGGYSPKAMLGSWVAASVASVVIMLVVVVFPFAIPFAWLIAVAVVVLLWCWLGLLLVYRKLSVHYRLSSQCFVHKSGILRRVTDRIEVIDMDDVSFSQGIIERLVNVGSITIESSDRSHPRLVLLGIENVEDVSVKMDGARRKERMSRGLHIEAV